ncbi:hypothetical protein [Raineyella sp. W15-4]|uniref:hypothetical protein n=1 Tax=Raineyella sp. W15-4 TaxID=3081651 RepID=UPI002955784D|nr:hypothetical protein [Raineyella sp. W15-4]WOQ16909.1 hypothetical protein R0145_17165 [Raineyella sp. W15-4]
MSADPLPDPDGARAALEEAAEARRSAVDSTRRPAWIDAVLALTMAVTIPLALLGPWVGALVVLVVGSAITLLAERRFTRRRGRILDARALGARTLPYALVYLAIVVLMQFPAPAAWQPWYALGVGLFAAIAVFVGMRWEERYQARRIAAGDYHRYDLL